MDWEEHNGYAKFTGLTRIAPQADGVVLSSRKNNPASLSACEFKLFYVT